MRMKMKHRGAMAAALLLVVLGAAAAQAAPQESASKIDINSATAEELQALPGIGPSLAEKILRFRKEHGPFETIDDLLKVQGIGEKTLDRFRDQVTAGRSKKR